MRIGIDVGGTHADGAVVHNGRIIAKRKAAVGGGPLHKSIVSLLEQLVPEAREEAEYIHLSTTHCTNLVVNDRLAQTAMFIQAGPGLNPSFLACGEHVCFISGAIDHRGKVVQELNTDQIEAAAENFTADNISAAGIVTKFSHLNNQHETAVYKQIREKFRHISLGHRLSGRSNFPRRVYTAWLDSSLKQDFLKFCQEMEKGIKLLGFSCPLRILKADGGTMSLDMARENPGQTVHSGPSASILGGLALIEDMQPDAVLLDIGGTTTDISLFAGGQPLFEPYGTEIASRPTLIRALLSRSAGLGGDSAVKYNGGKIMIGPEKTGRPAAFGGQAPTPTDAMMVLGMAGSFGSEEQIKKARQAIEKLMPDEKPLQAAEKILDTLVKAIRTKVYQVIDEVFSRPVYTISALLERKKIKPARIVAVGGPAAMLQPLLEREFGLPCLVPEHYEVANAAGAALARQTIQLSLHADTELGRATVPELSITEDIPSSFGMDDAEARLKQLISRQMPQTGQDEIEFTERFETRIVKGGSYTGRIISLTCQIRPGIAINKE
ncbi:MAG: methylhydantoinase [Deltaproteobacteria bacterium]|nr:MAG: methylhydantoinase [Deltaproteobacteria bacterium]